MRLRDCQPERLSGLEVDDWPACSERIRLKLDQAKPLNELEGKKGSLQLAIAAQRSLNAVSADAK